MAFRKAIATAPVVLIASQIMRDELGFKFPQEVDFKTIYSAGTVFREEIRTPAQARRMTRAGGACPHRRRGIDLPVDVSQATAPDEPDFAVYRAAPIVRPNDLELNAIAEALNAGHKIAIYGGSGCAHVHDQVVALAERLKAPGARTSRTKDFLEYDNPYDVGMTGIFGTRGGFHALVARSGLVMPPIIKASHVLGIALYSAKAVLAGRIDDLIDLTRGVIAQCKIFGARR